MVWEIRISIRVLLSSRLDLGRSVAGVWDVKLLAILDPFIVSIRRWGFVLVVIVRALVQVLIIINIHRLVNLSPFPKITCPLR